MGIRALAGASFRLGAILGCGSGPERPPRRGSGRSTAATLGALFASLCVIATSVLNAAPFLAAGDTLNLVSFSAAEPDALADWESGARDPGCSMHSVASILGRVFFAADAGSGIPGGGGGAAHLRVIDDHGDEPSTSSDISTGFPVKGLIGTPDDADYFRLVLGQPTLVSIYTTGGLDTVGSLIDSDGREVAADDDGGKLSNFHIQANLPQGIHYVQIRASGNATGNYELRTYAQTNAPAELTNSIGMDFALVPAGEFDMGSVSGEADQRPVTRVEISRAFYMGRHEVTSGQWLALMGAIPQESNSACGRDCPVVGVSWADAQEFVRRLNATEGTTRYRLPTEAEWEYAARAGGTRNGYLPQSDLNAWSDSSGDDRLYQVGTRWQANAFALHDMVGNASEWVGDWYGPYPGGTVADPSGPKRGTIRVLRGSSHRDHADRIRASQRGGDGPGISKYALGLRVAMSLEPQTGKGVTGADDHGNEPSDATPLAVGSSVAGRIAPSDDVDYFSLELSERSVVAIYTIGSLDTLGSLRDGANQKLAGDDDSGGGANFRIEATLDPGIHYVRVESYQDAEGSYTLHVDRRAVETPSAGELTNTIGMEFALVPAGEFDMGDESGPDSRRPVTRVQISRAFYMGKHEVSQRQWEAVMGSNPSRFPACGDDCPVEQVSWVDAQEFARKLNEKEDTTLYRLPTEAEWEYAARAGTTGERYFPDMDAIAWYEGNSEDTTHPVGAKRANSFGLYDMLGNVWEWVEDWFGPYPGGTVTDPVGPSEGSRRVVRGGGYSRPADENSATARGAGPPSTRYYNVGLRLAISAELVAGIGAPSTDDHGDEPSLASPLEIGTPVSGLIEQGNDIDFFRLEFSERTEVAIFTTGSLGTTGSLRDSANREEATDNGGGGNFRIEATLETGVYYVRVESQGDGTGGYTLHLKERTVFTNPYGMVFELVPSGQFDMGSTSDEAGAQADERPVRRVQISQDFYMGKYEVTQRQWKAVMGEENNPSVHQHCDDCPVDAVSWDDALVFVRELNKKLETTVYRLPTEAEWEYAARAGEAGEHYHSGPLDEIAWYEGNSGETTHQVGEKRANAFGLHDMLGNVWEWVQDRYATSYPDGPVPDPDPAGPATGSKRVLRGGSWYSKAETCRLANRYSRWPGARTSILGLRLAMTDEAPSAGQRTPSQATRLVFGTSTYGSIIDYTAAVGNIIDYRDQDFFRLDLSGETKKTDLMIYTTGSLKTWGTLWKDAGTQYLQQQDSQQGSHGADNFVIEASLEPGVYFVGVKGLLFGRGNYTLHVQRPVETSINLCLTDEDEHCDEANIYMEFVELPADMAFAMGSESDDAQQIEGPVTPVKISRSFHMGRYEVTQKQWEALMGEENNPSVFNDCDECPVDSVTWDEVQDFIYKLNQIHQYGKRASTFRLPTEAEWEFAARAGTTEERYSDDLGQIAWYRTNSDGKAHPVGQKLPNRFGLHDMLGNVTEWVEDWSGGVYPGGVETVYDPIGPATGRSKVARGCSWFDVSQTCRSARRASYPPNAASIVGGEDLRHLVLKDVGFRLVTNGTTSSPQRRRLDDHPNEVSSARTYEMPSDGSFELVGDLALGDVDYFKLRLDEPTQAIFSTNEGLRAETNLGVWYPDEQQCDNLTPIDGKIRSLDVGWYCIEVNSANVTDSAVGSYTITVHSSREGSLLEPGEPIQVEDNFDPEVYEHSLEEAEILKTGFAKTIAATAPGTHRLFKIPAFTETTRVKIYLSSATKGTGMAVEGEHLEVLNLSNERVNNFPAVFDLQSGKSRFVSVLDTGGGGYTLLVEEVRPVREEDFKENSLGMQFVQLPSSEALETNTGFDFHMGSEELWRGKIFGWLDDSLHPRPIDRRIDPFWMGTHEVTQCEWASVMEHPTRGEMTKDEVRIFCGTVEGSKPIVDVTFEDAQEFVSELQDEHAIEGLTYRLPKEAEWEYAAQAGTWGEHYGKIDEIAWYKDNSDLELKPVRTRLPNAFGLYDMLGNVWEWVDDDYERDTFAVIQFARKAIENPWVQVAIGVAVGATTGGVGLTVLAGVSGLISGLDAANEVKVLRGGGFKTEKHIIGSSVRYRGAKGSGAILKPNPATKGISVAAEAEIGRRVGWNAIKNQHGPFAQFIGKPSRIASYADQIPKTRAEAILLLLELFNPLEEDATKGASIGFRVALE